MCSNSDLEDTSSRDLIALLRAALEELAGRAAPDSPTAALEDARELGRALDVGEAALAVLVHRVDSSGVCRQEGYPATVSWLRTDLGMSHGRAAERVTLARQLPRLEHTSKLLAHGELSAPYAREICHAVKPLDDADTVAAEDILLGLVNSGAGVREVAKAATRITDLVRQQRGLDGEPEDGRRQDKRSWLRRSRSLDGGSFVKGWLSPLDEATFAQIIDPLTKPTGKNDPRDAAQRQADALMSVLAGGGHAAGVTIIADLAALTSQPTPVPVPDPASAPVPTSASAPAPDSASASAPDSAPTPAPQASSHRSTNRAAAKTGPRERRELPYREGLPKGAGLCKGKGASPGERVSMGRPVGARLLNGTAVSPAQARRLALTAGINLLLLGKGGHPLYLGRRVRFATPAQRRVLEALYSTCVVTGCDIPAHLCEIHHLGGGWKFGTPTDINQLVPACRFHNAWIEDHTDQVTETTDQSGRTQLVIQRLRRADRPPRPRSTRTSRPDCSDASSGERQPQGP